MGRTLITWSDPSDLFWNHGPSHQEIVFSVVEVPLEAAESALFQYTHQATVSLYEIFDGFEMTPQLVENIINKTFRRRS
jgi:hypothetical protein